MLYLRPHHLVVRDPLSGFIGAALQPGRNGESSAGFSAANAALASSKLRNGLPAQFMLIKLNSRCSIGFHFEQQGG